VDLVDRHRLLEPRTVIAPLRHPRLVVPLILRRVAHDRRRLRRHFERAAERIGLLQNRAARRTDLELVFFALGQPRNEDLPEAAWRDRAHRVHAAVPCIEVADDAHAIGIRGPHGEMRARRRPDGDPVRAKFFERMQVRPLAEQVNVEIGEDPPIPIRIVDVDDVIAGVGDAEAVVR